SAPADDPVAGELVPHAHVPEARLHQDGDAHTLALSVAPRLAKPNDPAEDDLRRGRSYFGLFAPPDLTAPQPRRETAPSMTAGGDAQLRLVNAPPCTLANKDTSDRGGRRSGKALVAGQRMDEIM